MEPTLNDIAAACAEAFETNVLIMKDKTRKAPAPDARKALAFLKDKYMPETTWKVTGKWLGGRDHSTMLTARREASNLYDRDYEFRKRLEDAEKIFKTNQPAAKIIGWG